MRRAIVLIVTLCALSACFPKGWRENSPLYLDADRFPFKVGPYVMLIEQGSFAVAIKDPALKAPPTIEWWLAQTSSTSSASPPVNRVSMKKDDGFWLAKLEGLPKDQKALYRVRSELGDAGPIEVLGGRTRGKEFRFAAFGDTRTGHRVHRKLIEMMAKEEVEFVIHSGDLVEFGGIEPQWDLFFQIEEPVISRIPVIAAVGNHDNSQRNNFRRFFLTKQYAGENRYYYQDWGDVRVVTLDSEIEMRAGSAQYTFVEAALREGAQKDMLMLMSLHYPPYSSGSHGSNLEVREVIGELAPRFGVEVVLAGHDHDYERTKRIEGVTYIVAASGGANIRRLNKNRFSEVLRTEPHFVLFDIQQKNLVGRAVNLNGNTFDTFIIPPNPPRDPKKSPQPKT